MKRCLVLGWLLLATAAGLSGQEAHRLVSAQVVTATDRPPVLKLGANGPIAFRVLPDDEAGAPATGPRLVARLYGVAAGQIEAAAALAPFSLSMRTEALDTIIIVSVAGDLRLDLRSAMRANEVDVVAMPAED